LGIEVGFLGQIGYGKVRKFFVDPTKNLLALPPMRELAASRTNQRQATNHSQKLTCSGSGLRQAVAFFALSATRERSGGAGRR
jgi:hypothetical protein